jgi:hypothetical protein
LSWKRSSIWISILSGILRVVRGMQSKDAE